MCTFYSFISNNNDAGRAGERRGAKKASRQVMICRLERAIPLAIKRAHDSIHYTSPDAAARANRRNKTLPNGTEARDKRARAFFV